MEKYYTPNVEDLRVGYECEILWNQDIFPEDDWYKVEIGDDSTKEFDLIDWYGRVANSKIRTPYLTKEQIENEGWVKKNDRQFAIETLNDGENFEGFDLKLFSDHIHISSYSADKYSGGGFKTLYNGKCPSINEFRTISKWIGI